MIQKHRIKKLFRKFFDILMKERQWRGDFLKDHPLEQGTKENAITRLSPFTYKNPVFKQPPKFGDYESYEEIDNGWRFIC